MLYVLNIGESTHLGQDLEAAVAKYNLAEVSARPTREPAPSAAKSKPNSPKCPTKTPPNS